MCAVSTAVSSRTPDTCSSVSGTGMGTRGVWKITGALGSSRQHERVVVNGWLIWWSSPSSLSTAWMPGCGAARSLLEPEPRLRARDHSARPG